MLDADIRSCFDQIDHDTLIAQIERRVSDRDMVKLLRAWLRCGIMYEGTVSDPVAGTPQGAPLSPLLANIALHVLDVEWEKTGSSLGVLVRYADDLVILCRSRVRAEEARRRIGHVLGGLGLQLHPDKTRIVFIGDGSDGFDFLGFHHRMVDSGKYRGRRYLHKWPSRQAMATIRDKIRHLTARRYASRDLHSVVADLNRVLHGWGGYFRHGNSGRKFVAVDSYVHERLAKLAAVKHGRRSTGLASWRNYSWVTSLGIYRLTGTVQWWSPTHARR